MSDDKQLKSSDMLVRALVRLHNQVGTRKAKDEEDFLRKKNWRKTGLPENGLSTFRKSKFENAQAVFDRMGITLPVGLSECEVEKLEAKGLKLMVDGAARDHVSVRCPECDMKQGRPGNTRDLTDVCKPLGAADYKTCPFFDVDTFDLEPEFAVIEEPTVRTLAPRKPA